MSTSVEPGAVEQSLDTSSSASSWSAELSPDSLVSPGDAYQTFGFDACEDFEASTCAICLELLLAAHRKATLPCGHAFHAACVERLRQHGGEIDPLCPLCRADLPPAALDLFHEALQCYEIVQRAVVGPLKTGGWKNLSPRLQAKMKACSAAMRGASDQVSLPFLARWTTCHLFH